MNKIKLNKKLNTQKLVIIGKYLMLKFCLVCLISCNLNDNNQKSVLTAIQLDAKPLLSLEKLNGHKAVPVRQQPNLWLANSENYGVMLFDQTGKILQQTGGNYEGLDTRTITPSESLVISLNKELGQIELFELSSKQSLIAKNSLQLEGTVAQNICLYQDPNQGDIFSFILTVDNRVEQRLVYLASKQTYTNKLIRSFSAPPASEACVVNDQAGLLYIVEETVGVWQYQVDPEKDLNRQPIALTKPFGFIEGEIKDVSLLLDGSIILALPESKQIQHYAVVDSKFQVQPVVYQLEQTIESLSASTSISISTSTSTKQIEVSFFDDNTDSYFTTQIARPISSQIPNNSSIKSIQPSIETDTVSRFGDAADDPAIWVNKVTPEQSLILSTDKTFGLYVFDLAGKTQQTIATGRINNIDVSYQAKTLSGTFDFAAASNRTNNSITLYKISSQGLVSDWGEIKTSLPDVYGLCNYQSQKTGIHYVFINDESGHYQQYQIDFSNAKPSGKLVRVFKLETQPEGCVADATSATLYVGEEDKGIWKITAEPDLTAIPELIYEVDNKTLFDDVEGLAIYHGKDNSYLVASSQGNDSYLLISTQAPYQVQAQFKIGANLLKGIDGASETDGLDVTSANLGGEFSQGLLVVQDGRNVMPSQPQNFKLVPWQSIAPLISNN
ncbi:phytase [Catenovulum maritimum]|uniref:phytase n=1 Tax=Catenovulum maritimum TaxID=1513271 RepID=UPI0006610920|nr:phytase [Catenovulum maritimum]